MQALIYDQIATDLEALGGKTNERDRRARNDYSQGEAREVLARTEGRLFSSL
jgi:hypothetical protein